MYEGELIHAAPCVEISRLCEGCMEVHTRGRFCRACTQINEQLDRRYEESQLSRMMESLPREQCGVVEYRKKLPLPLLSYRAISTWEFMTGLPLVCAFAAIFGMALWVVGRDVIRMLLEISK